MRDLPGHRKRERSWKDEVKERVRSRRQQKNPGSPPTRGELPLFDDRDAEEEEPEAAHPASVERDTRPLAPGSDLGREWRAPDLSSPDLADMPLHETPVSEREAAPTPVPRTIPPPLDEEPPAGGEEEWRLELPARPQEPAPLERPAFARERAAAAGLDGALMLGVAAIILYFAGRAARVPVAGLRPAWPWLVGYLALLGLVYAGYFTGTIGQTLGKMVTGLRVVDRAGHPPGFLRAFVRGGLGAVGVALLGLGLLPMLFDPARRALHDRLLRMRVVRR